MAGPYEQLDLARKHPKVTYAVTPPVMTDEELFSIVGEEGSVDLVTVATAVHWFDLDTFYSQVKRVLRKPGGVIAVWFYGTGSVSPTVDTVCAEFLESTTTKDGNRYVEGWTQEAAIPLRNI